MGNEENNTKYAESDGHAVLIHSMGQWGKGRTIHEAASNHPAGLTKVTRAKDTECIVQVFTWKEGDKIPHDHNDEPYDSMYDCIFVDGVGSTHYAFDMNVVHLNKTPVPLTRLFTKKAVEQ